MFFKQISALCDSKWVWKQWGMKPTVAIIWCLPPTLCKTIKINGKSAAPISASTNCVLSNVSTFQRQGEEDRSSGKVHLPDGPPHPQHQGRPLNTGPWQLRMNSQRLKREHVNFDCCPLSLWRPNVNIWTNSLPQIIIPQKQVGRNSDIYVTMVSYTTQVSSH